MSITETRPSPPIEADLLGSRRNNLIAFTGLFFLVVATKWWALDQLPVWDSAMSVFPAAQTIADHGIGVFSLPPYAEGGANVHASSVVTWVTAASYVLMDRPFVLLHLVHFAVAALGLLGVWKLAARFTDVWLGLGVAIASFLIPIVRTQAGYMYLEIPLMAAAAWAVHEWLAGRRRRAAWLAVLAVAIKPTGIIVVAALAATTVLHRRSAPGTKRELAIHAVGAVVLVVHTVLANVSVGAGEGSALLGTIGMFLRLTDVVAIVAVLVAVLLMRVTAWRDVVRSGESALRTTVLTMSASFVAVGLYQTQASTDFLPRYLATLLPLWIVLLAVSISAHSKGVAWLTLSALTTFSLLNATGDLYPDNSFPNFAHIERSEAYRDLYELHVATADHMSSLPSSIPVFYDLARHYQQAHPGTGYFTSPLTNGNWLRDADKPLDDYPDDFYLHYEHSYLGGEIAQDLWQAAEDSERHTVSVERIRVAAFEAAIVRVTRVDE